jgi:hypothetical protein
MALVFPLVTASIQTIPQFHMEPREPILKNVLIFGKNRGADAFPGFVWWAVWAESPIQIKKFV